MNRINRNIVPILCIFIMLVVSSVAFIQVIPLTVLRNWTINVPQTSYHPGDTIQLTSTSTKLRKAQGAVERIVECNVRGNSTVGYSINQSVAVRSPGYASSTYSIKIPTNVTDLPTTCRVIVTVTYKVYKIRTLVEHADSNQFIIQ